jgi:hypothetical protein
MHVAIAAATGAVGLVLAAASAHAQSITQALGKIDDTRVCGVETLRQEKAQAIPDKLLHAISLVESGRWDADRKASFAWPWTVTAEGEGHFLPSKEAAIAEVERLQKKGIDNIDVGCMQVNLRAHPDAFANLDQAFDPASNVSYGARFLAELRASTPDWQTAAGYYHSQTPALAAAYESKLVSAWRDARGRADDRGDNLMTAALEDRPPIGMLLPTPPQTVADLQAEMVAKDKAADAASATQRAERLAVTEAERAEAKRIADAYRAARLEEWHRRKLEQLASAHSPS